MAHMIAWDLSPTPLHEDSFTFDDWGGVLTNVQAMCSHLYRRKHSV